MGIRHVHGNRICMATARVAMHIRRLRRLIHLVYSGGDLRDRNNNLDALSSLLYNATGEQHTNLNSNAPNAINEGVRALRGGCASL